MRDKKIVYKNTITYTVKHANSYMPYTIQINTDKFTSDILEVVDELIMSENYENIIIAEHILHQNEQ